MGEEFKAKEMLCIRLIATGMIFELILLLSYLGSQKGLSITNTNVPSGLKATMIIYLSLIVFISFLLVLNIGKEENY